MSKLLQHTIESDIEQYQLSSDSILGGLLSRIAIVIFSVETIIMLALEIAGQQQIGWRSVFLCSSTLTLASGAIVYPSIILPFERRLRMTIRELKQAKEKAEHFSRIDPLTALLNRRSFFERFEQEWKRTQRNGNALSCIMIDIDFFKRVNDTYGHLAGDAVLKIVGAILNKCCRAGDEVCRFGGEEFCIMAPETDLDGAGKLAERIRHTIEQAEMTHADEVISITVSIGVAQLNERTATYEMLVDAADQSLLEAKLNGRNQSKLCEDPSLVGVGPQLGRVDMRSVPTNTLTGWLKNMEQAQTHLGL